MSVERTRGFVVWTLRHGRALWLVALLLAIPATWRTAQLYIHLKSDLEELLPREAPSVRAIDELRARMPGLQYLGVVVETGTPENLPAAERFLDDLTARVRSYPPDLAATVRVGTSEERIFLEKHAPLYVDVEDLQTVRKRIEARRDWEVSHATDTALDEDDASSAPKLDFSDIEKKYDARIPKRSGDEGGDRYSSKKLRLTAMLIEAGGFDTGSSHSKRLVERVKADIAALGGTDAYAPGMRWGFSGEVTVQVEELEALVADLSFSSVLVILAVIAVIVLYYRWWRSVVVLVVPLLLAATYSFAIASLWPFRITELNSNTAFLGSIIVGNGINFGLILVARYAEERRKGELVEDALTLGVWSARTGTLSAALAASVAYASLVITQFRGFRQFGFIGGIGMIVCWAVTFVLVPPLVAWLDSGGPKTAPPPIKDSSRIVFVVARAVDRLRAPIALAAIVLTVGATIGLKRLGPDQLEYDFSKLRRSDTWANGDGYWSGRLDQLLGQYLTPTVMLTDSPEEARALAARLREEATRAPLDAFIASVRTLDDVLPLDQRAKLDEAAAIREMMTPKMRSLVAPEKRDEVDRLLGADDPDARKSVTLRELPPTFTKALVERDGSAGTAVLVFPKLSKALWEGPSLVRFVEQLRGVAGRARVAGSLPLSADILSSIQHDGPIATGAAFFGVCLVVLAIFRRSTTVLWVIGSLFVGVLWLAGGIMAFDVKINFANFIAFPITFGVGVDYAVNVMSRYMQEGDRDILKALRETGSAVALCSMTTIIGYSSLLVAKNRALHLFGLIAVLGEVTTLVAAIVVLPAILLYVQERRASAVLPSPR